MDISVIIPTYNEEKYLAATLEQLVQFVPPELKYEIIIVDNNSTDRTLDIAEKFDAMILKNQKGTIGSLRNAGVKKSSGKILLFLDADVSLTQQWKENLSACVKRLHQTPSLVTGSTYGVSQVENVVEKYWFAPLLDKPFGHINSGHLIVTRELFDSVNGFDETLITGEDYDFSRRCKNKGSEIFDDRSLFVRHEGYPKTIKAFFRRETWHGMGDFQSFKHFITSYVAVSAMIIFFASLYLIYDIFLFRDILSGLIAFALIILICGGVTFKKYKTRNPKVLLVNSSLYYIYFLARAYSFPRLLFEKNAKRKRLS